jgi:uncharacterized membrane protein YdjX (TVP38/TMEM64 family)
MLTRRMLIGLWIAMASVGAYAYFGHRVWLQGLLTAAMTRPGREVGAVVLLLGAVRGFTFVPATMLVLAALPFLPPTSLLALTLAGILISSSCLYFFAGAVGLDRVFESRYPAETARVRDVLTRHEIPIIVGWSFFPVVPTDLICYVCGVMRVNFVTFLLSVTAGEGAICALYIYGGDQLLRWLRLR